MSMLRLICLVLLLPLPGAVRALPADPPISGVLDVSMGGAHSCLLTALGGVRCWGFTGEGRLGIGDGGGSLPSSLGEPQRIQVPPETVFTRLAAGNGHTCALRNDRGVTCWGKNYQGQLGDGSVDDVSFSPVAVPGLSNVVDLASGDQHTCALIDGGTVRCWGDGSQGQLGNAGNGTANSATPLEVTGLSGVVQIAAGGYVSCARLASGAVSCWGQNSRGQLGRVSSGLDDFSVTPANVAGLGGSASDLALGVSHTCALVEGRVRCWGEGAQGELGDGGTTARHTPGDVLDTTGGGSTALTAVELGAGDAHTCAVRPSGALVCWGSGGNGSLGHGSNSIALNPVAVQGLDGSSAAASAVAVDGGNGHTCARIGVGELRCWGANVFAQLGDGSTTNSNTPVTVLAPQELVSLSASATSAPPGTSLTFTLVVNLAEFSLDDLPVARVTFYDGRTPISGCSELSLAGSPPSVSCTTSALGAGVHEVSALYSGGAFSSPTLAGPRRISITAALPTLRVHTFNFSTQPPSFGAALTSIFEDTRPFEPFLVAPSPITTHLLIADNMPVAFEQLTFTAASSNTALFDAGSFRLISGEYGGQKYKAVAVRPKPNASGNATITYSVSGPGNSVLATTTAPLAVTAVNDPPSSSLFAGIDGVNAYSLASLPDAAASGSQHLLVAEFLVFDGPADESAQTLTPQLVRSAGSATSPITGNPALEGSPAPAPTGLLGESSLSASYRVTASGEEGWVRFGGRLLDDGGGICYATGEGLNGATLALTALVELLIRIFSYDDNPPGYVDAAIALSRPPPELVGDGIQLAPAPNFCSRASRLYLVAGEWALLEATAQAQSQLSKQLGEVFGVNISAGKAAVSGERYLLSFRNAGNIALAGVRLRIGQPPGVTAMTWTCERSNGTPCATASGTGPVDLTADLAIGDAVHVGVDASFDGSQAFVSLRGEASYPPGVQAIRDGTQAVTAVTASSGDGVFYGGFER